MLERQTEVSDVEVVLTGDCANDNEAALTSLRDHGLRITDIDQDDGVVEGTINSDRLLELKRLPCVAHLRDIFTYLSEDDVDQPEGGQ